MAGSPGTLPTAFPASGIVTVFLDRDGVINRKMPEGEYVRSWSDFHILPGVPAAIARLNRAGLRVLVVSNQRGVALGHYTIDDVERLHQSLQKLLEAHGAHIDAFYVCPHDRGQCSCRKPLTGLYERARADFPAIDPRTSVMIGDSLSDLQFGIRAGMSTIFIAGPAETQKEGAPEAGRLAGLTCGSFPDAVNALLPASI